MDKLHIYVIYAGRMEAQSLLIKMLFFVRLQMRPTEALWRRYTKSFLRKSLKQQPGFPARKRKRTINFIILINLVYSL